MKKRIAKTRQCPRGLKVTSLLLLAGLAGATNKTHAGRTHDQNLIIQDERPVSSMLEIPDLDAETTLPVSLYLPSRLSTKSPAVVLLPGLMADVDQYESYIRELTKSGFIVAAHSWYSPLTSDEDLARETKVIADWITASYGIEPQRLGLVGHSMGAKDAVLAAGRYGGFAAIVAIDPDDSGNVSAVDSYVAKLSAPLLLIGAEVAWQAPDICAPLDENYQRFFEQAPNGTIELTLRNADHVQVLDDPDRFGYNICRAGTADSRQVRDDARHATVAFLVEHLLGGPPALAGMYSRHTAVRVAKAAGLRPPSKTGQLASLPSAKNVGDDSSGTASGTCSTTC